VKEAILSVIKQSFKPYEIIVVNNGKRKICLPSDLHPSVSIYDIMQYAGVSQARNFGALLSRGDFLAFLDDDDLWNPKYLENVAAVIARGASCVISRIDKLEEGRILPFKNPYGKCNIQNILTLNPGITGSNVTVSKEIFFEVGGYDPKLTPSEDKALILELLKKKIDIEVLPDNQAILRMHEGERLTSDYRMSQGIYQFTQKYASLMNRQQYLFNWVKIHKHKYLAGNRISFLQYFLLAILYKLTIFIKKIYELNPKRTGL
jgi:glycosyltransferase involved in cell wall biosynthesis